MDRLSFTVPSGEILGFLGPNGAGKTTTMRMLTCYLPPTSGTAVLNGMDIFDDSLEVRRIIGYLPESVPLYNDMRVKEYLAFRARIHGLDAQKAADRMAYVLEKCRLQDVDSRIIGQLSKGYRQRVGLAGALIHDPKVLILDEPTIGLDPNQIRETRALIKDLGKERTILLSTHILPEVEAVCQRVIILDKGRLVAMDTPENLVAKMQGGSEIYAEVRGAPADISGQIRMLAGILSVACQTENGVTALKIQAKEGQDLRERVSQLIVQSGGILRELRREQMKLEDVFVKITTTESSEPVESPGQDGDQGDHESHQAAVVS